MTSPSHPEPKSEDLLPFAGWLVAATLFLFPVDNPDLFWHISAGREIFRTGAVPAADWLSWSRFGHPWLDFEWLCQVLYALLYGAAGLTGLWLFKAGLFAATAWAVLRTARLHGTNVREESCLLAALSLGLIPSLNPRPENFSVLFFALELWFLESRRLRGPRWSRTQEAVLAAAFFSLWSNLHAGFVYGLALALVYAAGPLSFTKFVEEAHLPAAAALGSILNPLGPDVYRVLGLHSRLLPVLQRHLVEWRPSTLANRWQWPYWGLLAATAAAVVDALRSGRRLPGAHVLALAGLAYASLQVSRNSAFFCLGAAALLPALLGMEGRKGLRRLTPALLGASVFFCAIEIWPQSLRHPIWVSEHYPVQAADFLEKEAAELSGKRMYNPWGWGGYLGFRLGPAYKVFVDGRYIFHDLLDKLVAVSATPGDWGYFLGQTDIRTVVLEMSPQTINGRPFYTLFMPQKDWVLAYWDRTSLVFVRRAGLSYGWMLAHEYQYLWPGDLESLRLRVLAGKVPVQAIASEIDRLEKEGGDPALVGDLRAWLRSLIVPH